MKWRPTPPAILVTARRLVGDAWEECQLQDLRPGDIFRAVGPDGDFVNPSTHEYDEACIARVADFPVKNDLNQCGSLFGAQGYGVPIDLFPSMDELKRKGLS